MINFNATPFRKGYSHQIWAIDSLRETNLVYANFKDTNDVIKLRARYFDRTF